MKKTKTLVIVAIFGLFCLSLAGTAKASSTTPLTSTDYVYMYKSASIGETFTWSFSSSSSSIGITVMAMDATNFAIFSSGGSGYSYSSLLTNTYYQGSGTFSVPSAAIWYVVCWYSSSDNSHITLTYSLTSNGGTFSAIKFSVPSAPQSVTATGGTGGNTLSWSTPAMGTWDTTGYKIYRGSYSGGETYLATISGSGAGTVAMYEDDSAVPGNTYYYEIVATNSAGDSVYSNEVSAVALVDYTPLYIAIFVIALIVGCVITPLLIVRHIHRKKAGLAAPKPQQQQQQQQQQTVVVVPQATPIGIPAPTVTQVASTETKYCSTCGATIKNKSKFCDSCGAEQ